MTSESTSETRERYPRHLDSRDTSAAIVDKTRQAWLARPEELLPLEAKITVGIGFAALTRGGWVIFEEDDDAGTRPMTVAEAEQLAQRAPEHEWCIHLVGPGQARHYKRVGEAQWKLYRWGGGIGRSDHRSPNRRQTPRGSVQR
jgi:hypothetical protein